MKKKVLIAVAVLVGVTVVIVGAITLLQPSDEYANFNIPLYVQREHIRENAKGTKYVNNMFEVFFESDVSQERILEIIQDINGEAQHGLSNGVVTVQIPSSMEYDELEGFITSLKRAYSNEIQFIVPLWILPGEDKIAIAIPDDPWKKGIKWDEEKPSDLNWWLEVVQGPSAWEYDTKFDNITIGIADNSFDIGHEDLSIDMLNPEHNGSENHGTQIAGVIGATANNKKGITGLVWNSNLVGIDVFNDDEQRTNHNYVYEQIEKLLKNGIRVINLSTGLAYNNGKPLKTNDVPEQGILASLWVAHWIDKYDDFIIVQAAGNNGIDARRNGRFCSITLEFADEMITTYGTENSGVTVQDIVDRTIIVGAAEKVGNSYKLAKWDINASNYGPQISIVAPGENIYSTMQNNSYGRDGLFIKRATGTSMAAPIVTGVVALVWSVKGNDFTPGEVKDIVCNYTKDTVISNQNSSVDNRTYQMVNAKLAVEEAIRRVYGEGAIIPRSTPEEIHSRIEAHNESTTQTPMNRDDVISLLQETTTKQENGQAKSIIGEWGGECIERGITIDGYNYSELHIVQVEFTRNGKVSYSDGIESSEGFSCEGSYYIDGDKIHLDLEILPDEDYGIRAEKITGTVKYSVQGNELILNWIDGERLKDLFLFSSGKDFQSTLTKTD